MIDKPDTMIENQEAAKPASAPVASNPSAEATAAPTAEGSTEPTKTVFARSKGFGLPKKPRVTDAKGTPTKPPEAFAGGPPKEEARTIAPASAASPGLAGAMQDILASPEALADIGQVALDGAVLALATYRYGKEEAQSFKATAEAKREVRRAMLAFLAASSVKMTPGQALIVAIAAAYGPPVFEYEMAGKAKKK